MNQKHSMQLIYIKSGSVNAAKYHYIGQMPEGIHEALGVRQLRSIIIKR